MYTLRKITEDQEVNYYLGNNYKVITERNHKENFKKELNDFLYCMPTSEFDDKIYGFIFTYEGQTIPLYTFESNFIMTDSGKTLSNLSYR